MTDPAGLKLPLKTRKTISGYRVYDSIGAVLIDVWAEEWETQEALKHRADLFVAVLTADAELGAPPCDCIEKKGQWWNADCQCGNPDDRAGAAAWCAEANILCRKTDAEKEAQGG